VGVLAHHLIAPRSTENGGRVRPPYIAACRDGDAGFVFIQSKISDLKSQIGNRKFLEFLWLL
jgi:hypothetical protein